nr:unnamed protein product [Callosobruchus chinensis]
MKVLQSRGYEAIWFDKRKDPSCLNLSNICGFILNVPSDYKISFITLPLRRKHWIAIREINGIFYNLDSKLDAPQLIGQESELLNYLREELDDKEKQLFLVVTEKVGQDHSWLLDQNIYSSALNNINDIDADIVELKDIHRDS